LATKCWCQRLVLRSDLGRGRLNKRSARWKVQQPKDLVFATTSLAGSVSLSFYLPTAASLRPRTTLSHSKDAAQDDGKAGTHRCCQTGTAEWPRLYQMKSGPLYSRRLAPVRRNHNFLSEPLPDGSHFVYGQMVEQEPRDRFRLGCCREAALAVCDPERASNCGCVN